MGYFQTNGDKPIDNQCLSQTYRCTVVMDMGNAGLPALPGPFSSAVADGS